MAALRRQVVAEPLRESGWRLLALALSLSGNPAAALETLGDARTVLAEQLGVSPGPALRELYRAVVSGDDAAVRANIGPASPGSVDRAADPIRALVALLAHELGLLRSPGILVAHGGTDDVRARSPSSPAAAPAPPQPDRRRAIDGLHDVLSGRPG